MATSVLVGFEWGLALPDCSKNWFRRNLSGRAGPGDHEKLARRAPGITNVRASLAHRHLDSWFFLNCRFPGQSGPKKILSRTAPRTQMRAAFGLYPASNPSISKLKKEPPGAPHF